MSNTFPNRIDAWDKVSGKATYAADYKPERLLIALALRSPVGRGTIKSIDIATASAMKGVAAVFTHANARELGWRSDPETDALGAEFLGRSALDDPASGLAMYRPLCGPEILFAGQWIAVVVAETIESAREALDVIAVEYESWPLEESSPISPGPFFAGDMQHERGDAGIAGKTDFLLREIYETPMQLHQPMEPSATTAVWDGDTVTLHDSTQGVHAVRSYVAKSLNLSPDSVRVIAPFVGGGFGAKNQVWPHQALAAHLARHLGRPVCLQLTRADMAVASGYRSETRQEVELRATAEGRLRLLRHVSHVSTSLRGGFFEPCGLNSLMLYEAERVEIAHHVVRRTVSTPTPFRAPGETPGSFALETALDELAFKLKMNPLELRLRNFARRDNYHNRPWSSNNLRQCYEEGAQRFGWPRTFIEPRSQKRGHRLVGYGMATTAYPAQALPAAVRLVLDIKQGLRLETSATDIGTGMRTILLQTVAERLQFDESRIQICLGDSALPEAPTAGRSKSSASVLPAAIDACRALLDELDRMIPKPSNEANANNLFRRLEQAELESLTAEGRSGGMPEGNARSYYSFGAHFAEVEVDERVGRLRVRRLTSALDCGHIVNRNLAESQIMGGITFGIGMALMENCFRHPENLRVLSDNLADYAIPVNADMPEIEIIFVEHPDFEFNEMGVRGLGEIGLPGVAAAIGCAVHSATGRRVRTLPIPLSALVGDCPGRSI